MESSFLKYKGIHPGLVLARELKKRKLKQRPFAILIGEYAQSFNAILQGRRSLPVSLALKIEKQLDLEEGTFVLLQAYYEIEKAKQKEQQLKPDTTKIRPSLFWDTEFAKIQWKKMKLAVISRVFEKGNLMEQKEIVRFYGENEVREVLSVQDGRLPYKIRGKKEDIK